MTNGRHCLDGWEAELQTVVFGNEIVCFLNHRKLGTIRLNVLMKLPSFYRSVVSIRDTFKRNVSFWLRRIMWRKESA